MQLIQANITNFTGLDTENKENLEQTKERFWPSK